MEGAENETRSDTVTVTVIPPSNVVQMQRLTGCLDRFHWIVLQLSPRFVNTSRDMLESTRRR
jgi:hypothetical protein